ncbi:neuroendocrine protein 7B2 [Chironomus tepperi]|uniref:neuroendocrine protein 7B2 n=1 Tax=Chironomus tepperi TaxID=113505 RepID=UPI00391FA75F
MACLLKIAFLIATVLSAGYAYYSDMKDTYIPDDILRDLIDSFAEEASDEYDDNLFGKLPPSLGFLARAQKDQTERMMDYDSILERTNPHPSLRDEEHTQHSSLWGYQFMTGGGGEGPNIVKPQVKTDATLPAYCNPPNPCPVGYTEEQGCTNDFENTASFSREYQSAQECMCDTEHMFECPAVNQQQVNTQQRNLGDYFRQFPQEHKNMVAKKFWVKKSSKPATNPYLEGPKLPIAAKKGYNVN